MIRTLGFYNFASCSGSPLHHLFDGLNAAEMELLVLLLEISSFIRLA